MEAWNHVIILRIGMASRKHYFAELWKELSDPKPHLRSAYLIYGPEEMLARKLTERMCELCGDVRPFDFSEYLGTEVSIPQLAEDVATLPMMADRRVIIVLKAEKLLSQVGRGRGLSDDATALRNAIKESETACLICIASPEISIGSIPGRALHKHFFACGVYPLNERQLHAWISRGGRKRGIDISRDAAAKLLDIVGNGLLDVENELDKLAIFLGGSGTADANTIVDLVGVRGVSLQEFLHAVADRNIPEALAYLEPVLLVPRNAYRVIPALTGVLMEIHAALCLDNAEFKSAIPSWRQNEIRIWSRNWTEDTIVEALDDLYTADLHLKSGVSRINAALVEFLVGLA